MWKNIGNFLERFANLKPSQNLIKEESAKIIGEILNTEINPEKVEERDGVLYMIIENPSLKNEIFIRKSQILETLKNRLGAKSPRDLRF